MPDPTNDDADATTRRRSSRDLVSVVGAAVRLVWNASPGRLGLTLGVQVVASVSLLLQLLLIEHVLAVFLEVGDSGGLVSRAVLPVSLLAVLTAATTVATNVGNLQERLLSELVSREVWRGVLGACQAVDLRAYDDPGFYDQAERVRSNAATETQNVVQALVLLMGDALAVIASTAALLALAPVLLPFLLLSGVPLLLASSIAGRREFAFAVQQSPRRRTRNYLEEVLAQRGAAVEVRAFSLQDPLRRRWEDLYTSSLDDLRRHVNGRLRLVLAGNAGAALLTTLALVVAVVLVDRGQLSVASAGAALVAVRLLGGRVAGVTANLGYVSQSAHFLQDLGQFLRRGQVSQPRRSGTAAPADFERLTVSDVSFTYPGSLVPALHAVSLEIRRGEVVAVVGENGSGKSTLAKLLADLYEPDEGTISWDGVDLTEFEPDSVRRRIAAIFQDFMRYQFTARENIALGRAEGDADEEAVRDAARKADADGFISALTAGYDTLLSKEYEGGTDLSLGQWQRVALARAFIREAGFIVLDEPSASLDPRAESELHDRVRSLSAGRTVLLISHRFSTVRTADRIYVLSEGRVVEEGNHASLISRGGLYAELFELQARAYQESEST